MNRPSIPNPTKSIPHFISSFFKYKTESAVQEPSSLRYCNPFSSKKPNTEPFLITPLTPPTIPLAPSPPPPPHPFMGKRLPSPAHLQSHARAASALIRTARPGPKLLASSAGGRGREGMEEQGPERRDDGRAPLSEVVSHCVRRWFQDALKEARAGDIAMQVLVGQMYHSGYGVARNEQKAKSWISKASRHRSSVWKVSDKRPGYNASDSDSDEMKDGLK